MLEAATVVLVVTLALGLVRTLRGPSPEDRLLGLLYCSTTAIALLMTLQVEQVNYGLVDTALVLVVLAPVLTIAMLFVRRESSR